MAGQLLRDVSEITRQIMDGEADDHLDIILQAVQARKHNIFRPGTQVRVKNANDASLNGQVGVVIKVLAKRIHVGLVDRDEFGFKREINFPPEMLEIVGGE